MPNWVFNTLNGYTEELYEKYKGEEEEIDFNKVIPEPEEITNTPSGGFNRIAKDIVKYKNLIEELKDQEYRVAINRDPENPFAEEVKQLATDLSSSIGQICIEAPDKSLNELLEQEDHISQKGAYDKYVAIFGNKSYPYPDWENHNDEFKQIYQNYIDYNNDHFLKMKNEENSPLLDTYSQYEDLEDMGKKLNALKEKYGFDNWYDWRLANWGTKWNASSTEYDADSLVFDTAWNIPYPIIAKIAEDNPEVCIDGYSEEETGWFEEYKTQNGEVQIIARGDHIYDEDKDESRVERNELENPEVFNYQKCLQESIEAQNNINNIIQKVGL